MNLRSSQQKVCSKQHSIVLMLLTTLYTLASTDFNAVNEDEDEVNVWEDNWDDDNVEDDFSVQLKAHLEKQAMET